MLPYARLSGHVPHFIDLERPNRSTVDAVGKAIQAGRGRVVDVEVEHRHCRSAPGARARRQVHGCVCNRVVIARQAAPCKL